MEESLSISMGSMVAVVFAPVGGRAVLGLAVEPLPPMAAAGARSSARAEQGCEEDEVRGGERLSPPLLFIAGVGGGFVLTAPTISTYCGKNGRTTCCMI